MTPCVDRSFPRRTLSLYRRSPTSILWIFSSLIDSKVESARFRSRPSSIPSLTHFSRLRSSFPIRTWNVTTTKFLIFLILRWALWTFHITSVDWIWMKSTRESRLRLTSYYVTPLWFLKKQERNVLPEIGVEPVFSLVPRLQLIVWFGKMERLSCSK